MLPALPIGIDDFHEFQTKPECLYVDKTKMVSELALNLLSRHPQVFLARPRRFGKTLLVSTLECLFRGDKDLFRDTWLGRAGRWDWTRHRYEVLRLNMAIRGVHARKPLEERIRQELSLAAGKLGVEVPDYEEPIPCFIALLEGLQADQRKPVVLIDEYDTPITENIERPEAFDDIREAMRAFYGVLKDKRTLTQCIFVTGITRFAKASFFSGANHFKDISLASEFNSLLGFTERELRDTPALSDDLKRCADNIGYSIVQLRDALRSYYNGYQFSRNRETVYNPLSLAECLDVLRAVDEGEPWYAEDFPHGWAASGKPDFLFRLMQSGRYLSAARSVVSRRNPLKHLEMDQAGASEPDYAALMYHTGYLTLKRKAEGALYLDLPNKEVEVSFNEEVLHWQNEAIRALYEERSDPWGTDMRHAFLNGDADELQKGIDHFFRQLPHTLTAFPQAVKTIAAYEMYYQNMLFSGLQGARLPLRAEEATAEGRIDIVIEWPSRDNQITILEFKVKGAVKDALDQVWAQGYADRYRTSGQALRVFGLLFDPERRSIARVATYLLGGYDTRTNRWENEPNPAYPLAKLSALASQKQRREQVQSWNYPIV